MQASRLAHLQLFAALGIALASANSGLAQRAVDPPVAVSPGSDVASRIDQTCPTFSWGGVQGARSYDLVVYRVDAVTGDTEPVLRQRVAGSALSWTPALDSCFSRGARYAWSLRALGEGLVSDWSEPRLFDVAAGPTEAELLEAMAIVRRHAEERGPRGGDEPLVDVAAVDPVRAAAQPATHGPRSVVPSVKLRVDGGVDAAAFLGDGSGLTNLDPANLAAGVAGIDITGDAANVTGVVLIANGGTGATSAANARDALDVAQGPHVTGAIYSFNECVWTDFVNDYDLPFEYSCPDTKVLRGVSSVHSNTAEDRIFKFLCCAISISLTK